MDKKFVAKIYGSYRTWEEAKKSTLEANKTLGPIKFGETQYEILYTIVRIVEED